MIRLVLTIWLAVVLPTALQARPVQVTSGEHDGFTRLVLDYGGIVDWQLGRTTDGYELQLSSDWVYDLTGVYDLIGRGRLASVWVDPQSGALQIGVGCACHAQPFEFRPGIVVIDLKDGPPQSSSSFETPLNGDLLRALAPRPAPRPRARPTYPAGPSGRVDSYNWTSIFLNPAPQTKSAPRARDLPSLTSLDPGLQPLRDVLLHQLSRGAARGVVDLALPALPDRTATRAGAVQIRISDLPGVRIDADTVPPTGLMAQGQTCITDDQLDLANWGSALPVSEQMADAMTGLIGEFDAPDPVAELRAARFFLHIGFGAEAVQILGLGSTPGPDTAVLISLAHILDDTEDPAPAFVGMAACNTAAALWAVLVEPAVPLSERLDRSAILRSFSALPVHLRRWLGPRLIDRFLARNDSSALEAIREAVLRAPGQAGPGVTLMEARLDLAGGHPGRAEQRLQPLISSSGPATADAMIALVETHLVRRAPMEPDQIIALEGLLHERKEGPDADRFAVALARARALAGDFDKAFTDLSAAPSAAPDVWELLAEIGPDSALLSHAITQSGMIPAVSGSVAVQIARRLSSLGFPAQAGDWLRQVPDAEMNLAARIALQAGDGRTALRLMAGSEDPALAPLRSEALYQLADELGLADMLASYGDEAGRWRAVTRARDWPQLAGSGPDPLKALAATAIGAAPSAPPAEGVLAQGETLLDSSARTRQHIANLLATVAGPTTP